MSEYFSTFYVYELSISVVKPRQLKLYHCKNLEFDGLER